MWSQMPSFEEAKRSSPHNPRLGMVFVYLTTHMSTIK